MDWNRVRFRQDQGDGFYESYFQRANHPSRPLAFWIRYTIFSPKGAREKTEGELWAMWFDGEKNQVSKAYEALPWRECSFEDDPFRARIGRATLGEQGLEGACEHITWKLRYESSAPPLLLYPADFYDRALPKAKQLAKHPAARYFGAVTVGGEAHAIEDWLGTQSHNWGPQQTNMYAWAQIAGFDDAPDALFEGATGKLRIAGMQMPKMTAMVLRVDGEDHAFNSPYGFLWKNQGEFRDWTWTFDAFGPKARLRGTVTGKKEHFLALPYRNPPGGVKRCLNSKIAACAMELRYKDGRTRKLHAANRVAFEILGDPDALEARGFR